MKGKKFLVLALAAVMIAGLLAGCGSARKDGSGDGNSAQKGDGGAKSGKDGKSYTFQVGHVVTTDHSYHLGLLKFAQLASDKSGGRIHIEIFPGGQLGNERDLVEGLTMGTIDMALANSANLGSFTDCYQVFDFPFLFRDADHAHAVLDSDIGNQALTGLEKIGIKGLSNWENGFFCTWNSKKPIRTPADMKGMKIRANDNPIHIATYTQLGASPITMGWSEVYSAIQNGTVDGVSVSVPSMYSAKIQEVAPYLSESSEFYVTVVLMMNKDLYESLPEDIQTDLKEAAEEAKVYQRQVNQEQTDQFMEKLKGEGYTITEIDRDAFKKACWDSIYKQFSDKVGADKLNSIINDY